MSSATAKPLAPKKIVCPACQGESMYSPQNIYRPFCSQRCKNIDLGAWASEDFRMVADAAAEDADLADPKL